MAESDCRPRLPRPSGASEFSRDICPYCVTIMPASAEHSFLRQERTTALAAASRVPTGWAGSMCVVRLRLPPRNAMTQPSPSNDWSMAQLQRVSIHVMCRVAPETSTVTLVWR